MNKFDLDEHFKKFEKQNNTFNVDKYFEEFEKNKVEDVQKKSGWVDTAKEVGKDIAGGVASDLGGRAVGTSLGIPFGLMGMAIGNVAGGAIGSGIYGYNSTEGSTGKKMLQAGIDASLSVLPIEKLGKILKFGVKKAIGVGNVNFANSALKDIGKNIPYELSSKGIKDRNIYNNIISNSSLSKDEKVRLMQRMSSNIESNLTKADEIYGTTKSLSKIEKEIMNPKIIDLAKLDGVKNVKIPSLEKTGKVGKQFIRPAQEAIMDVIDDAIVAGSGKSKKKALRFLRSMNTSSASLKKQQDSSYINQMIYNSIAGSLKVGTADKITKDIDSNPNYKKNKIFNN